MPTGRTRAAGSVALLSCLLLAVSLSSPAGPTHSATQAADAPATADIEGVRRLFFEGRYTDAEAEARGLLGRVERVSGPIALPTAEAIDLLVEILTWQKKVEGPETLELAERALQIRERRLGLTSPARAQSLYRLGMVHLERNETDLARDLLEQSLEIRRKVYGPEHPAYAESLEGLGYLLVRNSEWDRAAEVLNEALEVRERCQGVDHPDVADSRMMLGGLAYYRQDLPAAERHFRLALEIREKSLGPRHPKVAGPLQNVAVVAQARGDVRAARDYYARALDIREEWLGSDDSRLGVLYIAVATLSQAVGDYSAAREQYDRSLELTARHGGTKHENYAIALTQLAYLNQLVGDYRAARRQFEQALDLRRAARGNSHLDVAKNLSALGYFLVEVGEAAEAKVRFEEALAIRQEILEPDSAPIADALMGLGLSFQESGDVDRARELLEESVRIFEDALGAESPSLIPPIQDLARILYASGDAAGAQAYLQRAVGLTERFYGTDHPSLMALLHTRARALASSGLAVEGFESALRAAGLASSHLGLTVRALPERQGLTYAARCNDSLAMVLTILTSLEESTSREVRRAWDALIGMRGIVLDEMVARHRDVAGVDDPALRELEGSLRREQQALANLTVHAPAEDDPEQQRRILTDLDRRVEELERQLASKSRGFRETLAREGVDLVDIERDLPSRSALVAYAKFDRYDPQRPSASPVPAYVAFVLPAVGAETVAIDLGTASSVDRTVALWRAAVSRGGATRETDYRRVATELRKRIWDPLAPFVDGAERVFIVPDGSLNLVNLGTLPDDEGGYLVESGPLLHLLTVETELVHSSDESPIGSGLLAMGGADFEKRTPGDASMKSGTAGTYRGPTPSCTKFRSIRFPSLPHAAAEVVAIADLWNASVGATRLESDRALVLTGSASTETAFKQHAAGHRVLHVATHGFFLSDRCLAPSGGERGVGGLSDANDPHEATGESDAQGFLSGLVFAGANARNTAPDGMDDGILTAEEIATLHLEGVQWAVLSACDTGVGPVQIGEGVLGLRRAFRIAGARTLIISLWPVADEATGVWMRELYRHHRNGKTTTDQAVREATLAVLRARRTRHASTHPFYWGAFVAAGDWR